MDRETIRTLGIFAVGIGIWVVFFVILYVALTADANDLLID